MSVDIARVCVELGSRSYSIIIGLDLDVSDFVDSEIIGSSALVVTNDKVGSLYLQKLVDSLKKVFSKVLILNIPDGEIYKN